MRNNKKHLAICICVVFLFALLSTLCYFGQKDTYSDSERRALATFPDLTWKNITSGRFMEQFEDYSADTFPFREGFRSIKAGTTLFAMGQKNNNGIYLHHGHLSSMEYPMDTDSILNATEKFEIIYDQYLEGANTNVYISVIPDKNAHLAQTANQLSMDYDAFQALVEENTSFATYIDISDLLSLEDYYHTDSHWRQEQIADVAERLAASMDTVLQTAIAEESTEQQPDYTINYVNETFYGVYHGQAALPIDGEEIFYLTNDVIDQLEVFDHENNQTIPVYDLEKLKGKDPYEAYLSGPVSLITIENPVNTSGKELILFRDSFGSSIAPLLATGYSKVTLVDIRYLPTAQLGKYVDFQDSDVLFLYSTSVLNHSETLK